MMYLAIVIVALLIWALVDDRLHDNPIYVMFYELASKGIALAITLLGIIVYLCLI